jgi:hypothetical protein
MTKSYRVDFGRGEILGPFYKLELAKEAARSNCVFIQEDIRITQNGKLVAVSKWIDSVIVPGDIKFLAIVEHYGYFADWE